MIDEEDERSTGDLVRALVQDYDECCALLVQRVEEGKRHPDGTVDADDQFEARQLVRAAFAFIEGATFVLKIEALFRSEERGVELTDPEAHFIFEVDWRLRRGRVVQTDAKISLLENVDFAFRVLEKASLLDEPIFNKNEAWWVALRESAQIRDRLTHPRWASDLDIAPSEVVTVMTAVRGFHDTMYALLTMGPVGGVGGA